MLITIFLVAIVLILLILIFLVHMNKSATKALVKIYFEKQILNALFLRMWHQERGNDEEVINEAETLTLKRYPNETKTVEEFKKLALKNFPSRYPFHED